MCMCVRPAGDDTQRQVGQAYHVKPSKIFRIFLTSLAPGACTAAGAAGVCHCGPLHTPRAHYPHPPHPAPSAPLPPLPPFIRVF